MFCDIYTASGPLLPGYTKRYKGGLSEKHTQQPDSNRQCGVVLWCDTFQQVNSCRMNAYMSLGNPRGCPGMIQTPQCTVYSSIILTHTSSLFFVLHSFSLPQNLQNSTWSLLQLHPTDVSYCTNERVLCPVSTIFLYRLTFVCTLET